jgi:hypothetical protein
VVDPVEQKVITVLTPDQGLKVRNKGRKIKVMGGGVNGVRG